MTQTFFPHPEQDSHDDDAETPEPMHDDILPEGEMGGGEDITLKARVPKRRLAMLTLVGFGVFAIVIMCFSPTKRHAGASDGLSASRQSATGRLDQPTRAAMPPHGSADTLDPLNAGTGTTYAPGSTPPPSEDFLDPNHLSTDGRPGGTKGSQMGNRAGGGVPADLSDPTEANALPPHGVSTAGLSNSAPGSAPLGTPTGTAPNDANTHIDTTTTNAAGYSGVEMARQHALDVARERDKQETAQREAATRRRRAEEQRLKSQGTLLAGTPNGSRRSLSSVALSPTAPAPDSTDGSGTTTTTPGGLTGAQTPGGKFDLLPGAQVTAVLTSTYVSDAQGTGPIAARLTSPLSLRNGSVLLPIGTRALGTATASSPGAGRPATVSITFNTFVTPNRTIIRTGLIGQGADPQTLALAVPAHTDNRFVQRILRGIASTAVDVMLASPTRDQAQSVFSAPTPYDLALERGGQRASDLINGPIGDENSVRPAVELEQDTKITILFGMTQ